MSGPTMPPVDPALPKDDGTRARYPTCLTSRSLRATFHLVVAPQGPTAIALGSRAHLEDEGRLFDLVVNQHQESHWWHSPISPWGPIVPTAPSTRPSAPTGS